MRVKNNFKFSTPFGVYHHRKFGKENNKKDIFENTAKTMKYKLIKKGCVISVINFRNINIIN